MLRQVEFPSTIYIMRILCLHDHGSSAAAFYKTLEKLENRLYNSHGIELVFVDSPFCLKQQRNDKVEHPVILKEKNCIDTHKDSQPSPNERAWFHKSSGDSFSSVLGLDASILHLRQIWSQSLLSRPFDGTDFSLSTKVTIMTNGLDGIVRHSLRSNLIIVLFLLLRRIAVVIPSVSNLFVY